MIGWHCLIKTICFALSYYQNHREKKKKDFSLAVKSTVIDTQIMMYFLGYHSQSFKLRI